jgi:hypothetical protein
LGSNDEGIDSMTEIESILAFEEGELSERETVELFQRLVDSGLAWSLQGSYGRIATALIDQGLIHNG